MAIINFGLKRALKIKMIDLEEELEVRSLGTSIQITFFNREARKRMNI